MSDEKSYPITYVKEGATRLVTNAQTEVLLRFDGWRPENEPAPERGTFSPLPPPPSVDDVDPAAQTPPPDPAVPSADSVVPGRRRQPRTTQ